MLPLADDNRVTSGWRIDEQCGGMAASCSIKKPCAIPQIIRAAVQKRNALLNSTDAGSPE